MVIMATVDLSCINYNCELNSKNTRFMLQCWRSHIWSNIFTDPFVPAASEWMRGLHILVFLPLCFKALDVSCDPDNQKYHLCISCENEQRLWECDRLFVFDLNRNSNYLFSLPPLFFFLWSQLCYEAGRWIVRPLTLYARVSPSKICFVLHQNKV